MRKRNELTIGALLSYASLIVGNAVSLVYTPIMIRILGQSEYGLFSLSNSLIGYLGVLDFGIGNAIVRYSAQYRALGNKDKEANLYGMFITIYSFLSFLVIIAGSFLVGNVQLFFSGSLSLQELNRIKIMLVLMIFNLAISFPFGIFSSVILAHEHFIFPKIIAIIRQLINPLVMLPLLLMGYGSIGLTIGTTILNIIFIIINVYYCFMKLNVKIKFKFKQFDSELLIEIIGYSFYIFLNMVVDKIYWATDQIILGSVAGTATVAIYSVASTINNYYMNFSTAITSVFLPKVTRMVTMKVDNAVLSNLFIRIGRIQFMILSLILGGFILIGKQFIILWAGSEYEDAYIIVLTIMIPLSIPLIQTLGLTIMQAQNKHKFRSKIYLFIAILNVLMSIPLAKLFGGWGCALATAVSMSIGHIVIMNIYYYKIIQLDISLFWREIFKISIPMITCLILSICIMNFNSFEGFTYILFNGCLYTFLYIIIMYSFGMNEFEKSLIKRPIKKFFS